MKIDDRVSNYMSLLNSDTSKPSDRIKDTAIPSATTSHAHVELSPDAANLADDEARRQRLNLIRQQLADGSYNISGKDVADKILHVLKGD